MADMTKTVGVGQCRVCKQGRSLLPTHICPQCWADRPTQWYGNSDVEFVDELPPSDRPGAWDTARRKESRRFAAELRRNPGRWAVYPFPLPSPQAVRTCASRITNGKIAAFSEGFTAVSRGGTVYVRYDEGGM